MKTKTLLLLLQSAVACTAFTLPDNLPNGVYHAHVDDQGLEVTEGVTVDYNTTVTPKKTSHLLKSRQTKEEGGWDRDQPEMWCGCGLSMNHGNCDTAVDMLKAQFSRSDGGVGEVNQAWYSIWGDVVAFCCASGGYPVTASRYADYLARITDRCGWYVPGTFSPSSIGFSSVDCGYMNYAPGLAFCDTAESGRYMGVNGRC
ncbi:hypothetical protein FSPOR_9158 [Fusarium sporotrichioides]|uniref:Uncharacterized protein n=1 Tax=Fusarium sporotrichioides TaxID=5514 RepID=A0A395RS20_FUSSP|nr:hypothetical protein FSPOR_9158 [Fusarium sporotrichioides]